MLPCWAWEKFQALFFIYISMFILHNFLLLKELILTLSLCTECDPKAVRIAGLVGCWGLGAGWSFLAGWVLWVKGATNKVWKGMWACGLQWHSSTIRTQPLLLITSIFKAFNILTSPLEIRISRGWQYPNHPSQGCGAVVRASASNYSLWPRNPQELFVLYVS